MQAGSVPQAVWGGRCTAGPRSGGTSSRTLGGRAASSCRPLQVSPSHIRLRSTHACVPAVLAASACVHLGGKGLGGPLHAHACRMPPQAIHAHAGADGTCWMPRNASHGAMQWLDIMPRGISRCRHLVTGCMCAPPYAPLRHPHAGRQAGRQAVHVPCQNYMLAATAHATHPSVFEMLLEHPSMHCMLLLPSKLCHSSVVAET